MTHLAAISFASPLMLVGLAGVALPIVAHLLNRRTRRRIVFPTIRLLAEASASQSRLHRLRHWIVLLLRCGVVALVALAFAQPVWTESQASDVGKDAALVLVLDTSASTGQQSAGVSAITALRARALELLDAATSNVAGVNVIYADAAPRAAFPQLVRNPAALGGELARVQPTAERADLVGAVRLAGELLATHPGPRRLLILSDMQASNWADDDKPLSATFSDILPAGTQVRLVPLTLDQPANVALSAPRTIPAAPLAGQAAHLAVTVTNDSQESATVWVQALIANEPAARRELTLAAGESREVSFDATFQDAGEHAVTFELPQDALEIDNRAYLVARVARRLKAALVGQGGDTPGSAEYLLRRALTPRGDANDPIELIDLDDDELTDAALAGVSVAVVSESARLSASSAEVLLRFIERGGGALVFANAQRPEAWRQAMPLRVGSPRLAPTDQPLQIDDGLWHHPALRAFDELSQIALGQIAFRRTFAVESATDATHLLHFNDGTPALSMRPMGDGLVAMANFGVVRDASSLATHGVFVALVQSLVTHLQPQHSATPDTFAGQPIRITLPQGAAPGGERIVVTDPVGRTVAAEHTIDGPTVTVHVPRAATPGFYRVASAGVEAIHAANVDPRESRLERIDPDSLVAALSDTSSVAVRSGSELDDAAVVGAGRTLWGWVLASALVLLGVELVVTGVWPR